MVKVAIPDNVGGGNEVAGSDQKLKDSRTGHMAENPFSQPSTLPYQLPPFDRIGNADYQPAFEQGTSTYTSAILVAVAFMVARPSVIGPEQPADHEVMGLTRPGESGETCVCRRRYGSNDVDATGRAQWFARKLRSRGGQDLVLMRPRRRGRAR